MVVGLVVYILMYRFHRYPAHFQIGNVPGDGDVFSAGGATTVVPGVYQANYHQANYPVYPNQPGAPGDYPVGTPVGPGSGRRDRSELDAQECYPADACVFVAK